MDTQEETVSLAELLCAISYIADIGMGQGMGHGLKSAYLGLQLADALGLSLEDKQAVYYGGLLKDAGCSACAGVFSTFFDGDDLGPRNDCLLLRPDSVTDAVSWFWRHAPSDAALPSRIAKLFTFLAACRPVMRESMATHCEVGEMFARRLALPEQVQQTVRYGMERWDGKGLAYGLKGPEAPISSRLLHFAQIIEVAHYFGGAAAAESLARERRGSDFDPEICDAFSRLRKQTLWSLFESDAIQETALGARPASSFDQRPAGEVDLICEMLADFADVKSRSAWHHSRSVSQVAVEIGKALGMRGPEVQTLRRAALAHDLGTAGVPLSILDSTPAGVEPEDETYRLHPQYGESVLSRIGPLSPLAAMVGGHHERLDGSGYPRHLAGDEIPAAVRVLAVADTYSLLSTDQGQDPERALRDMEALVGSCLDGDCYRALKNTAALPEGQTRSVFNPGNLTDREVEVLRLAAKGNSNRQIASELVLSERTVEHHLEHIFDKLNVSTRTSAVVFAVQNGLAP